MATSGRSPIDSAVFSRLRDYYANLLGCDAEALALQTLCDWWEQPERLSYLIKHSVNREMRRMLIRFHNDLNEIHEQLNQRK